MKNKGFTLIELLVVIAIIGILSSVVLASLNTARTKARKVAFKSEVTSLVPAAIDYCDSNPGGSYAYSVGTQIAAGTITCTAAGGLASTTIAPATTISGCTNGVVTDTGANFSTCPQ